MKNKTLLTLASLGIFTLTSLVLGYLLGWFGVLIAAAIFIIACGIQLYQTFKLLSTINNAPEGYTANAIQLRQHIHTGMTLIEIVQTAKALGKKSTQPPGTYTWQDKHHQIKVTFQNQKASHIELTELEQVIPSPPSN